jgi:hypothetical protein
MISGSSGIVKFILSVLLFPMFFQNPFLQFAWGIGDPLWIMVGKRLFFLLPVLAILLGCWISIACSLTVPFRQNRGGFLTVLLITWWDLGKSIVSFWGGIIKVLFNFSIALLGFIKLLVLGIWSVLQEIVLMPFRLIRSAGQNVISSPIPWIAVFLTVFWCILEALIFTYVMTPLVVDTFSNITGEQLQESFIRIPLFIFLLFIVLGSYAVISTMVEAAKSKKIPAMMRIAVIELVVLFVEVIFLYREFVDSLVPWFAQYSENFELGVSGTLLISSFVWFGIRSLSWFLFAGQGTPTIMAVIQGRGMEFTARPELPRSRGLDFSTEVINKIKEDTSWIQKKGEELMASIMLPPLQVIASGINFCTLLINNNHLFELPFKNLEAIADTKILMEYNARMSTRKSPKKRVPELVTKSPKEKVPEKPPETVPERPVIN